MKAIFVIFTCLIGLSCASAKSKADSSASKLVPQVNNIQPQQGSFDFPPDGQTLRVTKEPVLMQMLKPFKKKYNVDCKITLSDEASNKNPHWTCLNNSVCSYALTVGCFAKKGDKKQVLSIEVDGYDDNRENQIQSFTVTYLSK